MAENKYFSVNYELFITKEGEQPILVEKTNRDHCFNFITGLSFTLPDFEENIKHLKTGDKFDFTIPQDKAFGPYDETRVKELPKSIFRNGSGHFDAETIYPGNVIPMENADGMHFDGLVKEVKEDTIVIDFNNEFAGMDLRFRGEIIECHDATPEEITSFVNAMSGESEDGCHGNCGGHCGHHGEGGHCHNHHGEGCCGGHSHGEGNCGCGHCH